MNDISKFKDIHKGERIFVIGNGPSLARQNLDCIKDKITIGCNLGARLFTPTYLCIGDRGKYYRPAMKAEIDAVQCPTFFPQEEIIEGVPDDAYRVYIDQDKFLHKGDRWHPELEYTVVGYSVMTDLCIPLAYYMGAKEVVILGVDFTRRGHFYDGIDNRAPLMRDYDITIGYSTIDKIFKDEGKKIWNATPNTRLRSIKRRQLEDIMKEDV